MKARERFLLRELRMRRGYSQRRLAERSGLTQAHICHLERGTVDNPSLDTVKRLAAALRATREQVLDAMEQRV